MPQNFLSCEPKAIASAAARPAWLARRGPPRLVRDAPSSWHSGARPRAHADMESIVYILG